MKGCKAIWVIYIILIVLSCTFTYSAMSSLVLDGSSVSAPFLKHVMFLVLGSAIIVFIQILDFRMLRILSPCFLAFAVILLVIVTIKGGGEDVAANRFSAIGQPSEYVKLGLILVMSEVIMQLGNKSEFPKKAFYIVIGILAVIIFLILAENLSTAIIISATMVVMMWAGGLGLVRVGRLVLIALIAVAGLISIAFIVPKEKFYVIAKDYPVIQKIDRIYTWRGRLERHFGEEAKNMSEDVVIVTDNNRQEVYAKVAVCRGGWFPSGLGSSLQRNYLPVAYTDYIFAIAVEEGGFMLGIFIVLIYLTLFMICLYYIVFKEKKIYRKLILLGCAFVITFQAAVHIAVSVGAMPVTGQTLPLISRGGASILVVSAMFGLIIKITATPSDQTSIYAPQPVTEENPQTDETTDPQTSETTNPQTDKSIDPEPLIETRKPDIDDDDDSIIIFEE